MRIESDLDVSVQLCMRLLPGHLEGHDHRSSADSNGHVLHVWPVLYLDRSEGKITRLRLLLGNERAESTPGSHQGQKSREITVQ